MYAMMYSLKGLNKAIKGIICAQILGVQVFAATPSTALDKLSEWITPPSPSNKPKSVELLAGNNREIESKVIELLKAAESEVLFSYYSITSQTFLNALTEVFRGNILMSGLMEGRPKEGQPYGIQYLIKNLVPINIPPTDRIHNENYIIVDRRVVISGSFYPSNNKENSHILIIDDIGIANEFYRVWYGNFSESTPAISKR